MKKIIASILAVGISVSCIVSAGAANINMCVKDNYVTRDLQTLGSVDMIPILDIAGELGLKTYFDGYNLWIEDGYRSYKFTLNSANVYDVQGNWYGLDVTMRYINKKLYIPSTFLTNVLGISYSWDNITKTLYIDADRTLNWIKNNQEYRDAVNCRTAYANYLKSKRAYWDLNEARFELGYLNNDDIPELFVAETSIRADAVCIYTYKNGQMIEVDVIGTYGHAFYKERTGLIYSEHTIGGWYQNFVQKFNNATNKLDIVCNLTYDSWSNEYKLNNQEISKEEYYRYYNSYGFDYDSVVRECNEVPDLYITEKNIKNGIYNF